MILLIWHLAILSEELNKPDDAIKYYSKAIEKNSKFFEAYFYMAGVYDDLGDNIRLRIASK